MMTNDDIQAAFSCLPGGSGLLRNPKIGLLSCGLMLGRDRFANLDAGNDLLPVWFGGGWGGVDLQSVGAEPFEVLSGFQTTLCIWEGLIEVDVLGGKLESRR